jgi:hypothetical protein
MWRIAGWDARLVHAAEDQRGIGAAETEGIRQDGVDLPLLSDMGHEIDRRLD